MKRFVMAFAAACAFMAAPAMAEDAAPAAATAAHFTTSSSTIGELLDNEGTRAVLQQHVPEMVSNPQIDAARGMTLRDVQPYAPDLTDEKLAAIDADLANVH